jgi:subtilisin family serine protease
MKRRTKYLSCLGAVALFFNGAFAQENVPQGWHLKDMKTDGYYGISLDKAYQFVKAKKLKSTPVIVGIVDSGIDTTHEDLKPVLWTNTHEIPGNGIDDDHNGYIDDIHGWNFIGSKDGKENVEKDSYEAARVYWKYKDKFDGKGAEQIAATDFSDFKNWQRAKKDISKDAGNPAENELLVKLADDLKQGDETIRRTLNKETYTCKDLEKYTPTSVSTTKMKMILLNACQLNDNQDISNKMLVEEIQKDVDKIKNLQHPPKSYRDEIVKDNYFDFNDKSYGNNNVYVSEDGAMHGTHVAGIIGAARKNGIGMDGIADNLKIMAVRAVPDGDEHDKDIALAIRYAVDNGARVINMSFGKGFSPEKKWVDDAIRYADSKGVLLVHAAGNDAKDNDTTFNYPSLKYLDGNKPANWVTVGASGDIKAGGLTASFSNYGKNEVDVFAPGVKIYSTLPGGHNYGNLQGTSMASPVVAGLAAFIMSYYPNLSAIQVKNIIEKTVSKPTQKVTDPGTGKKVWMSDLCTSGGIVNAYEAIKLASVTKGALNKQAVLVNHKTSRKKPVAMKK